MPCYNNMKNREDRDIISMFSSTPKLSNVRPQRYSKCEECINTLIIYYTWSVCNYAFLTLYGYIISYGIFKWHDFFTPICLNNVVM